jgi:hypothetical protein
MLYWNKQPRFYFQYYWYDDTPYDLSKYTRDGNHNNGSCYNPGYRGGSAGFMANGMPSGWDDDLPKDRETKRYVNRRRRNWDKKLIKEQLEDFDK